LALFFDDLQWLDEATLEFLEDLLTRPKTRYLLLIGADRDNEVDPGHPLVRRLDKIGAAGGILEDVILAPWAETIWGICWRIAFTAIPAMRRSSPRYPHANEPRSVANGRSYFLRAIS